MESENDTQNPFLAALDTLNQSYLSNGIPKARSAAQARGSLADVTAFDAEKARTPPATLPKAAPAGGSTWRRAADYLVSHGGSFVALKNGIPSSDTKDSEIPAGKFDIIELSIDHLNSAHPKPPAEEFQVFNGLRGPPLRTHTHSRHRNEGQRLRLAGGKQRPRMAQLRERRPDRRWRPRPPRRGKETAQLSGPVFSNLHRCRHGQDALRSHAHQRRFPLLRPHR